MRETMTREKNGSHSERSSAAKWEEVYQRLQAVQNTLAQTNAPTADQKRAILKARARSLAQEPLQAQSDGRELEIVEFRLAHETYGFESCYIREVYPLRDFSPVPCTPPFVLGLVNVRGQLLSIVDLKKFFGLASKELDSHNQAIILRNQTMEFCVLADSLLGVRHVARQSLQPSLPILTGVRNQFLLGITSERVIILDAEKLLSSRDIIVYEEVTALPNESGSF
jgi:purine-binding chemotaxis protein CheW